MAGKELRKRPKQSALVAVILLAVPLGMYGYGQYYLDVVPHSGAAPISPNARNGNLLIRFSIFRAQARNGRIAERRAPNGTRVFPSCQAAVPGKDPT